MQPIAEQALSTLLRKAERRRIKASSGRLPSLKFSQASLPAYTRPLTREALSAIHADLREAERAGAITIDWDRRAGVDGAIARIRLNDATALAQYIGVTPRWQIVAEAKQRVSPWLGRWRVDAIWARWALDQKVRGLGAERASILVDACCVLERLPDNQDVPVRRLSAAMFQNSKHIENALVAMLDELTRPSDLVTSDTAQVLQRLGLVKHPQPLMLAGRGEIRLSGGATSALHAPYTGLAPDHFLGLAGPPPLHVLTIENLTTFNEVARGMRQDANALVIYTGGMPSPALRLALRAVIAGCTRDTTFWHWGDIDVGGLRIALVIDAELGDGARLQPWQMDPSALPSEVVVHRAQDSVIEQMTDLAERLEWPAVATGIRRMRGTVEQEVLRPSVPF